MLQPRRHHRLAQKPRVAAILEQLLDRDLALERPIFSREDPAEAALRDLAEDRVAPDLGGRQLVGRLRLERNRIDRRQP